MTDLNQLSQLPTQAESLDTKKSRKLSTAGCSLNDKSNHQKRIAHANFVVLISSISETGPGS